MNNQLLSKRLKAVVVDDERHGRARIMELLAAARDVDVVAECPDGTTAIQAIAQMSPNLVFLDVQMPEVTGLDVIATIGSERMPATILVTAYDEYAIQAFDAAAVDYLLKPFTPERFYTALDRARGKVARGAGVALGTLLDTVPHAGLKHLVARNAGRYEIINVCDVDWIEAADNYVRIHAGGKVRLIRRKMSALERELGDNFLRIHRSTIVNSLRVVAVQPWNQSEFLVTLQDQTQLPSSRAYRQKIRKFLNRVA